jgi:hypothetical protein
MRGRGEAKVPQLESPGGFAGGGCLRSSGFGETCDIVGNGNQIKPENTEESIRKRTENDPQSKETVVD